MRKNWKTFHHIFRSHLFLTCLICLVVTSQGCSAPKAPESRADLPTLTPLYMVAHEKAVARQIKVLPVAQETPISLPTTPATLAPTPMKFAFPTLALAPITIWRPPLYPTPWEPTPNDHFYFTRPIGANEVNWPLAHYRYGGTFIESFIHTGIDIPTPTGTPVLAAGSGKVIWAGYGLYFQSQKFSDPYGLAIAIKHDFGYQGQVLYTIYGHMESLNIESGQSVTSGDTIGFVGETGKTTGPHLHFEVRIGENDFFVTRNPELWLTPPQGWGVLAARIMETNGDILEKQVVHVRKTASNQHWSVLTYAGAGVNSDPFYKENMVIGDLPAGEYLISTDYEDSTYSIEIKILPGMVTYVRFAGNQGFYNRPPATPATGFIPPDLTHFPTP